MVLNRVYTVNGLYIENGPLLDDDSDFAIQELICSDGNSKYFYPKDEMYFYLIWHKMEDLRYKVIEHFYNDLNEYYNIKKGICILLATGGYDTEFSLSKYEFANIVNSIKDDEKEMIYKNLFYNDVVSIVDSICNNTWYLNDVFISVYKKLALIECPNIANKDGFFIIHDNESLEISFLIENYFIKAYSLFDLFTKLSIELLNENYDYQKYKKLKSKEILYGDKKKLPFDKAEGTLFERCELTSKIESIRHEVVHSGSLQFNPNIYYKIENNKLVEKFIMFPDMDEDGHFEMFNNRKRFYSCENKFNLFFPELHCELLKKISNTVELLVTKT